MINTIKQIVKNYINSADLTNIVFGTVINTTPLQIQIDKLIIPNTRLIQSSIFNNLRVIPQLYWGH